MRPPQPLDYQNVSPHRRASLQQGQPGAHGGILRRGRLLIALTLSFVCLCWMLLALALSFSEPGSRSVFQWVGGIAFAALPFLLTFWIVYRCFCTDDMNAVDVFGCTIRPQALLRTALAELCVFMALVAFWMSIIARW